MMDSRRGHKLSSLDFAHSRLILLPFTILLFWTQPTTAKPLSTNHQPWTDTSHQSTTRSLSPKVLPRDPNAAHALSPSATTHILSSRQDGNNSPPSNPVNYYYVFIAIGVILLIFFLWSGRRRQRLRKAASLHRRHSALQQDASGWPTTRRFLHGRWQSGNVHDYYRPEDGLDARGEAPPPYQPGSGPPAAQQQQMGNDGFLTIPPPALTRDSPHKPPEYQATVTAVHVPPETHDLNMDEGRQGSSSFIPTTHTSTSPTAGNRL